MTKYGKAIFAFLLVVAEAVIAKWTGDNHIDPVEATVIATTVVGGVGVWIAPLYPTARWVKSAVGILLAGLAVAEVVILDHVIDANEAYMIAAAMAAAAGIVVAPAKSTTRSAAAGPAAVGWGADR
jgi:hypothetical protein